MCIGCCFEPPPPPEGGTGLCDLTAKAQRRKGMIQIGSVIACSVRVTNVFPAHPR